MGPGRVEDRDEDDGPADVETLRQAAAEGDELAEWALSFGDVAADEADDASDSVKEPWRDSWSGERWQKWQPAQTGSEHAVILHVRLAGGGFGTEAEREAVHALADRLQEHVIAVAAGDYDGDEFGAGEAVLYLYGPDKPDFRS